MRIFNARLLGSTSGGSFVGNLTHLNCLCKQVIVQPETESTHYDIKVVNKDGATIYERTSEIGTLSELVDIPMLATYTVTISNATADENFNICLVSRED